jgi:hypothetical protein
MRHNHLNPNVNIPAQRNTIGLTLIRQSDSQRGEIIVLDADFDGRTRKQNRSILCS